MKRITTIGLLCGFIFALYGQEDLLIDSVAYNITKQLLAFPQEKIYLQTDKPYYITGEKIFFRAFLLDAFSNRQDTLSRYVYVELINPEDSVAQRVKIRRDFTYMFYGAIPLLENLPQGNYKIRAYTRYMQNQGESSFFSKQVRIGDPQMLKEKTNNSQYTEQTEGDFEVSFYPEGGQLITGQLSNVAFKALDSRGAALDITGKIVDSQGNTVADFKTIHDGMGDFFINPLPDEHYRAVVQVKGKGYKVKEINLPAAQANAIALKALIRNDKLLISINRSDSASYPELYLLIHSRGSIIYAKAWDASKEYIALNTSVFPSGVNHIILLTKDLQIISERLVFLLSDDSGTATFQTQKDSYHKREHVQSEIKLKDEKTQPLVAGNFSIAITNDKEVVIDTTSSILSDILLRSELRGHIDNPEYYFQKGNKDAEQAADLLMRTNGWTRYAIPEVVRGKLSYPKIPFEQSQEISGIVKDGLRLKPAKNVKVSLVSLNSSFLDEAKTDESGRYLFRNFEFPDSTKYVVQATNSKGKSKQTAELYVDKDTFPGIHTTWTEPIVKKEKEKTNSVFLDYVAKADQQYTFEHGMRMLNLPEVEVRGVHKEQNKYPSIYYSEPDFSLSEEAIKKSGALETKDLLYRIPGIWVANNVIRIRGINSIKGSNDPLILVDNTPFRFPEDSISIITCLKMIDINDIGQIDVIKDGASLTMFGSRGMNGVINIHTKRGESFNPFLLANIKHVMPLGYQLPVEFYSPKYDTQEKIDDSKPDLRTTIYWKPNVLTDSKGNAKLDFYTADDPGTYSVVIEGVSEDGKLIHYLGRAAITVVSGK